MTRPAAITALLETARKGLDRVQPADLAFEIAAGALVVDIRPIEQRHRDGELPGALTIDRNSSSGGWTPPALTTSLRWPIPVAGSASSATRATAPAWQRQTLRQLGLERATDLIAGFQAWKRLAGSKPRGVTQK